MIPTITVASMVLLFVLFVLSIILFTIPVFFWFVIMHQETWMVSARKTKQLHVRNFERTKRIVFFLPRMLLTGVAIIIFLVAHVQYVTELEEAELLGT